MFVPQLARPESRIDAIEAPVASTVPFELSERLKGSDIQLSGLTVTKVCAKNESACTPRERKREREREKEREKEREREIEKEREKERERDVACFLKYLF